eukprot:CAMPEP_0185591502 /NCGR_PEP_ID=MMETSP0434-20130131/64750_1 /TAXON_ID=626734 ORGANISM="Favella taraikaensis, Strain Fe Narragansett Bay" /NCGR_SAMPLE_ID=MMETSP0434 /ASSEMBLY_ACC=CAM_ASM_000379 /LENGTH=38 /DNA_ID= /DNA_START= /DNA_END= /DNA_ORIENTATION=
MTGRTPAPSKVVDPEVPVVALLEETLHLRHGVAVGRLA